MRIYITWHDWAIDCWTDKRLNGKQIYYLKIGPINIRLERN